MEEKKNITNEPEIVHYIIEMFEEDKKSNIKLLRRIKAEFKKDKPTISSPRRMTQRLIEIGATERKAQVSLYTYNAIRYCHSFNDLLVARENLVKSIKNFVTKYNEDYWTLMRDTPNMSTSEINAVNERIVASKNKFDLLKDAIDTIDKSLRFDAARKVQPVAKESSPVIRNITPKRAEVGSEYEKNLAALLNKIFSAKEEVKNVRPDKYSVAEAYGKVMGLKKELERAIEVSPQSERKLAILHSEVFAAKQEIKRIDPNNKIQFEKASEKLTALEKERERAVAELTSEEDAHFMLSDLRNAEESTIQAMGINKKPAYTLTLESFKERLDELNTMLADLKFNGSKSKAFHMLHEQDHKIDPVTLSKDILRLSCERSDIIASVLGKDSPILKVHTQLLGYEGVYGVEEGYFAFKRQGGEIGGVQKNRDMFNTGRASVLESQRKIEEALREEFEKRGPIKIESNAPTYETERERRDLAYQKLFSNIKMWRKGYAIRAERELKEQERIESERIQQENEGENMIEPHENEIITRNGKRLYYDFETDGEVEKDNMIVYNNPYAEAEDNNTMDTMRST